MESALYDASRAQGNGYVVKKRGQRSGVRGHPGETRYAVVNEFHRAGISEGTKRLRADDVGRRAIQ